MKSGQALGRGLCHRAFLRRPSIPVCWSSPSPQHAPRVPRDWDETLCQLGAGSGSLRAGIPSQERGT